MNSSAFDVIIRKVYKSFKYNCNKHVAESTRASKVLRSSMYFKKRGNKDSFQAKENPYKTKIWPVELPSLKRISILKKLATM